MANKSIPDLAKKIRILCVDDPAVKLYDNQGSLMTQWSKENMTEVEVVIVPWAQYPEKIFGAMESASSEFDIVMLPGFFWLPKFAANEWLIPLENLAEKIGSDWIEYEFEDILPTMREELEINNRLYLLPSFSEVQIIYFRKDLLSKAGLSQIQSPLSLDDWFSISKALHNPNDGIYGTQFKGAATESMIEWLPFFTEMGGFLPSEKDDRSISENVFCQSLNKLRQFLPYCRPDVGESDNATLFEMLTTGKVGIVNHWSGQLSPILDPVINPNTSNYGFASLENPWGTVWAFGIPAASKNKQQAISCLLHMTSSSADLQQAGYSGSPVRRSTFENKDTIEKYPWLPELLTCIEKKKTLPSTTVFADRMGDFYNLVHEVICGTKSPEIAVQELNLEIGKE